MTPWFLVFDVESIGLHGGGFAVGAVLMNPQGSLIDEFYAACHPAIAARGDQGLHDLDDRIWVHDNVKPEHYTHESPAEVRAAFWTYWRSVRAAESSSLYLAADVLWPVEANFLSACIRDNWPESKWQGPYPLIDIASIRLAAGFDPLATEPRLASEEPAHNPLCDARQSARLLYEALTQLSIEREVAVRR